VPSPDALNIWAIVPVGYSQEFERATTQLHVMDAEAVVLFESAPPRCSRVKCSLGQALQWQGLSATVRMQASQSGADGRGS
jgi:hypothetical protein